MGFNFNKYKEVTFDVMVNCPAENGKKEEELTLHIVTPSLSVYEDLTDRASRAGSDGESKLELLTDVCRDILNLNREGVTFSTADVSDLPGIAVSEFVTEFFTWMRETRNEKN